MRRTLVAAIALAVVVTCYAGGIFNSWQEQLTDRFFVRGTQPSSVVIVAVDDASLDEIGQWPWRRETFAKAVDTLQSAGAIGIDVNFSEPSRFGGADDASLHASLNASRVPVVLPIELRSDGEVDVAPLPALRDEVRTGFVNVLTDVDGTVRKVDTLTHGRSGDTESFSRMLSESVARTSAATGIPAAMRIRYMGPEGTFLTLSFTDVMNGRIPARVFEGKYVVIGATANSLKDVLKTPFGTMPGVEVHANALSTILGGRYSADAPLPIGIVLLILVGALAAVIVVHIKRFWLMVVALAVLIALLVLASLASFTFGYILPLLYLLLDAFVVAGGMVTYQYITESREKRFIRESFQYYLSPAVVDELVRDPKKLALGGEKRTLSILFSDIRGFTTVSESLSPEALVRLMNEYLTAMTDIIMDHGGLVDKYIGDAIMAFWGAPVPNPHHARDAARAAYVMLEKLKEMNREWKARGIPHIAIGVGISTGDAIAGNMGSSKRFNYTIMGDEVNFASRLEGINKEYGSSCLVSDSAARALREQQDENAPYVLREIDTVTVKGKTEPRTIFELLPRGAGVEERLKKFATGLAAYRAGYFDEAIRVFEEVLAVGEDGPAATLLERSREFKKNSPPGWKGVYEFHTK